MQNNERDHMLCACHSMPAESIWIQLLYWISLRSSNTSLHFNSNRCQILESLILIVTFSMPPATFPLPLTLSPLARCFTSILFFPSYFIGMPPFGSCVLFFNRQCFVNLSNKSFVTRRSEYKVVCKYTQKQRKMTTHKPKQWNDTHTHTHHSSHVLDRKHCMHACSLLTRESYCHTVEMANVNRIYFQMEWRRMFSRLHEHNPYRVNRFPYKIKPKRDSCHGIFHWNCHYFYARTIFLFKRIRKGVHHHQLTTHRERKKQKKMLVTLVIMMGILIEPDFRACSFL